MNLDVDALAQEIRRVDGNHSLGAGQLAEALMPFFRALPHAGKVSEVLRKALPFVGWSASRQQILSGVDAGELYIEIEAALVSQQSSGQSKVSDEMVEALSPFVRHYEKWMDDWADDEFSSTYSRHTFGQLRRARALLAGREATLSSQQAEAVPVGYVTKDVIAELAEGHIGGYVFPKSTLRPENEVPLYTSPSPADAGEPAPQKCKACKGRGTEADYVGLEMRCVEVECSACAGTGAATSQAKGGAKPLVIDDLTEAEIDSRARQIVTGNGWKQGDRYHLPALLGMMKQIAISVMRDPPVSCAHPDCGCDFDAVCNAALRSSSPVGQETATEGE